ncbi:MAG: aminoglycoside phosphotransferase [Steroidobacteraceae bacterium]|nr:aminoglycoside phosphotransferase [Steroidobacteraceae bacterium]
MNDASTLTERATHDPRLQSLRGWLERDLGFRDYGIAPASADASFRRYFRVTRAGHEPLIVMDAPPGKEDVGPYLRVAAMLQQIGVNAPRVLGRSEQDGFLLLTDLGTTMYLPELAKPGRADALYADAITALVRIQAHGAAASQSLPAYDEKLLRFEMSLFPDWLLQRHLGLELTQAETQGLRAAMDAVVADALEQPQVFVHRDYHSRNLMVCPDDNPGILDFQDAVRGALTYDLLSLLRDAYIAWPQARVVDWARRYRREATAAGLDTGRDEAQFLRWFDLIGLQRQLKVAGIFARLWHRDGKPGYLADIPRTLEYAVGACHRQPDFLELGRLIEQRVLPAVVASLGSSRAG